MLSLDMKTVFCKTPGTFARFLFQRAHGIVIVLSKLPRDMKMKRLIGHMTANDTHLIGQDTTPPPLLLPSGWWIVPMCVLGLVMWRLIISGILAALS